MEMYYSWNGTYTTERGGKVGVLVWHIRSPVHLPMPYSAVSSGQHGCCAKPGQVFKAAATLTSKDQTTSIILIDGEEILRPY